jgi:GxxExxY protein
LNENDLSGPIRVHPRLSAADSPDPHSSAVDRLNALTEKIIGCAYDVANALGAGFLEKVYENALRIELHRAGLAVLQQHPIPVMWRGEIVGDYYADLLVESSIIIELKAAKALDDVHLAQCLNYLKATGLKLCLLINFGKPRIEIKRIVHDLK